MLLLALLCVATGVLPGLVIDNMAPMIQGLTGAHMPAQLGPGWLTVVPVGESRSSYNGLLLLLFIAGSASVTALAVHRLGSHASRRAPAWDCGFPTAASNTQYSAAGFSQPIRRVFASVALHARERVFMPPPGDPSPARIEQTMLDPVWDWLYAPIAAGVSWTAGALNGLQFLTIRRYLGLVFVALVLLLLALALSQ
jgi:hypothetical protein